VRRWVEGNLEVFPERRGHRERFDESQCGRATLQERDEVRRAAALCTTSDCVCDVGFIVFVEKIPMVSWISSGASPK
jgi:hypothetical protein